MTHELEVWLFSDHVGTLALVDGRLAFCYTAGWLSQPDAVALSHSLPVRAEPFDDRATRPFFAGLLPEGQMRRLIARQFQVSGQNDFALLYPGRTPILAPLYDTLSTAVYPTLTPKMAMKIGSKYKFSEVEARHWEQFAEGAGLAKGPARRRMLELANSLPRAARALQSDRTHGFAGTGVVERIVALIEQRCALTLRKLSAPLSAPTSRDGDSSASPQ